MKAFSISVLFSTIFYTLTIALQNPLYVPTWAVTVQMGLIGGLAVALILGVKN